MTSQPRSKTRLSRALGVALTPKAARYLEKRPYAPGEHGRTKRKADSDYAIRLREKQRLREQYNLREAQLRIQFEEARRKDGLTGENLVEQLEMRLDALVLRAGFARTMAQARQFVVHRHILVDGKLVVREREVLTVDTAKLRRDAEAMAARIRAALAADKAGAASPATN